MSKRNVKRRDFLKLTGLGLVGTTLSGYSFPGQGNKRKEFLENARKYIDTPYIWGGRLTRNNPGLDCMGLVFLAYKDTYGESWRNLSVYPSEIIKENQLGKPVEGLDGVLTNGFNMHLFEEGDIIHFLSEMKTKDSPSSTINGKDYWTWHMGIYSNKFENLFLEAHPNSKVEESNLEDATYLNPAVFITRLPNY